MRVEPNAQLDFGTMTAPVESDAALLFALVAESLSIFYEHDQWLTIAQRTSLSANWLARAKRTMPLERRRHLAELSDQMARQMAVSVSRAAGLHIAYEMTEALDSKYVSEVGSSLLDECTRLLAESEA
jgi:hypothetical protein